MQRRVIRHTFFKILLIGLLALMTSVAFVSAQSLGDVARENREKKAEDAPAAPAKVITNQDLPKDADAGPETAPPQPATTTSPDKRTADNRAALRSTQRQLAEQRVAEQWKQRLFAQKNRVATLQARLNQVRASIRATYGTVQYEGPVSTGQARQLDRAALIQQQLDEQTRRLDMMQEAARRAGMSSAVYDP